MQEGNWMLQKKFLWVGLAVIVGAVLWSSCSSPQVFQEKVTADAGVPETSTSGGPEKKVSRPLVKLHSGPLVRFVNPFVATGGSGFGAGSAYPGAAAPFGMVKVSPDTASHERGLNFLHCAGYHYDDDEMVGFSHIHLHGTGVPDYGNLLLMPVTGPITEERIQEKGYRSKFRHASEKASPGYYKVVLDRWKVKAELTATVRTAYHRYTYPAGTKQRQVLLRLDHALPDGKVSDAEVTVHSEREVRGWLHSDGALSKRGGGFKLFFVLRSREPFQAGTWRDQKLYPKEKTQKSARIGVWMTFPEGKNPVEIQVGLSFVSIEGAQKNLSSERKGWDFEATQKATSDAWEALLSVVKVGGGTTEQRRIFYTALYHVLQMPTILMDVDGLYRGLDGKVHQAKDFVYYSDFSLWDTYRTLHPLLVLLYPKIQRDMVRSLVAMAREGGELPRWPLATGYTSTMVGASADIVIADSYLKGIQDFDVEEAYKAMRRLAMGPPKPGSRYGGRSRIKDYVKLGYVPADKRSGSASITLEFAYNDYAIAQLAKVLGKQGDFELFRKRATNYKNVWDSKLKFFRGKNSDGSWLAEFTDQRWTKDYVEGTAWQYLFFVPHDTPGLVALFGGREETLKKLDEFFRRTEIEQKTPNPINLRTYYWHSNEPDLHVATLYQQLGRPADTQRWVRWIMKNKYKDAPDGLAGNDDGGTLSAWYIFNAMGIYPVPAQDVYLLTSPIFPRVVATVQGSTFEVRADNASEKAMYVKSVSLNQKSLQELSIKHTDFAKNGSLLHFQMSETK